MAEERKHSTESDEKSEWILRPMKPEDIDKCLLIWGRVELTEAKQTVASALAVDPEGFYVAELKSTGKLFRFYEV